MQNVDHSGNSSVFPESNQSLPVSVHQLLVVDETDVLLQTGIQERHIGLLCLDGMREEAVGLLRDKCVHRNLLNAEDNGRLADIFLDSGASIEISLQSE